LGQLSVDQFLHSFFSSKHGLNVAIGALSVALNVECSFEKHRNA